MNMPLLDDATFRTVVGATPLVPIDLIVRREDGPSAELLNTKAYSMICKRDSL